MATAWPSTCLPPLLCLLLAMAVLSLVAAEEREKADQLQCVSSSLPHGQQPCEGLCFDLLDIGTESIRSGCARFPLVCPSVGCFRLPDDDQKFLCCCDRPLCNGKPPHLVKARWQAFLKGADLKAKKSARRDVSQDSDNRRRTVEETSNEDDGIPERTTSNKALTSKNQPISTTPTTTKTTPSTKAATTRPKKTEKPIAGQKKTATTTAKAVTTTRKPSDGTVSSVKAAHQQQKGASSTSGNGITTTKTLGTTTARSKTTEKTPTTIGSAKVPTKTDLPKKLPAKEESGIEILEGNGSRYSSEEQSAVSKLLLASDETSMEWEEANEDERSANGTTMRSETTTNKLTTTQPRTASTTNRAASLANAQNMPKVTASKATTVESIRTPKNTAKSAVTETTPTTPHKPPPPHSSSSSMPTTTQAIMTNSISSGSSTTREPRPPLPSTKASTANFPPQIHAKTKASRLAIEPSTSSKRTTRSPASSTSSSATTTRHQSQTPWERAVPSFPWYFVALAGFICSSLIFFLVYWTVRGCRRIFSKRMGTAAGRGGGEEQQAGEPMIPMANGAGKAARNGEAKKVTKRKQAKEEKQKRRAILNGGLVVSSGKNAATNDSLVSQCTMSTPIGEQQNFMDMDMELGGGEQVTVIDPLLNQQYSGTMSK